MHDNWAENLLDKYKLKKLSWFWPIWQLDIGWVSLSCFSLSLWQTCMLQSLLYPSIGDYVCWNLSHVGGSSSRSEWSGENLDPWILKESFTEGFPLTIHDMWNVVRSMHHNSQWVLAFQGSLKRDRRWRIRDIRRFVGKIREKTTMTVPGSE